ncbi:glycosyltransferase (plasmid) [Burkholderia sp. MS455]|uniref:glycosyltransferase family 2 protein n=1 Tax=Burkholderia sp. MS455 TaxID=2811788 RepID=UPI00195BDF4A|nr:glycosyltransferase family 2 protein [Burkholderia sp. MS455]QRR11827.1 glycosyltransferase [Burkholderia sp. MS455]
MTIANRLAACGIATILTVTAYMLVAYAWCQLGDRIDAPDWPQSISGLDYERYRSGQSPLISRYPTDVQIAEDVVQISHVTRRLRTYSTARLPAVIAAASHQHMTVLAGAWLSGQDAHDTREIMTLLKVVSRFSNVRGLLIGNETFLTQSVDETELIHRLDQVRRATSVPVSTAQAWGTWLDHPELARHVDFIAVHLLPYWDKVNVHAACDFAFARLHDLQRAFPGKRIVVTEVGWPSAGLPQGGAVASPHNQSFFLRQFADRARRESTEYYVMEAYDQRWKGQMEGRAGKYWGIYDDAGQFKLVTRHERSGTYVFQRWGKHTLAGFSLLVWLFCLHHRTRPFRERLGFAIILFGAASLVIGYAHIDDGRYEPFSTAAHWTLVPILCLNIAVILLLLWEALQISSPHPFQRVFTPLPLHLGQPTPVVSLHLACANEPPDVVIATLCSLKALQYPNYEVLVISNNTSDDTLWRPIKKWVLDQGAPFRFWHVPICPGFKAQALNLALSHTRSDAELIGVVDADYVVVPNWLNNVVAHFGCPRVGLVQVPQAHRECANSRLANWISCESDIFFRIGMHLRNQHNAIIQHGTMTLIRASVMRQLGGWSEWTIAEDAELGLRIAQKGYESRYIDKIYGRGLPPTDFAAFRSQRRRWALGAAQILRRHVLTLFLPGRLTLSQRFIYLTGWLPWFADAFHLLCTLLAVGWTIAACLMPTTVDFPIPSTFALAVAAPIIRFAISIWIVRRHVTNSWPDTLGAVMAGIAVSYGAGAGIWAACARTRHSFVVTQKGRPRLPARHYRTLMPEIILAGLLWFSAAALILIRMPLPVEIGTWIGTLIVLSTPYLAALVFVSVTRKSCPAPRAEMQESTPSPLNSLHEHADGP